jgi:hypothetical protein
MTDDRPSAGELIGAVIEFLAMTARPALSGHARFESLIAIRLLQTAAGDYELGPEMRGREQERLEALLGRSGDLEDLEAELVEGIRTGAFTADRRSALVEALRATARDRLRIANPAYLREQA